MSLYPEHDKLALVQVESQTCGEFLDWLGTEKGWYLYDDHQEVPVPARININKTLGEFFGIDLEKLEAEKELMLEKQRELNDSAR